MKLIATKEVRIRVDGIKQDLEKGAIVEVPESLAGFYKSNWFIELDKPVRWVTLIKNDPKLADKIIKEREDEANARADAEAQRLEAQEKAEAIRLTGNSEKDEEEVEKETTEIKDEEEVEARKEAQAKKAKEELE